MKFLAPLLVLGLFAAPAHPAEGKWKAVFTIIDHDQPVRLIWGSVTKGPSYFDSEAACKDALENDPGVLAATEALKAAAEEHDATFEGGTCVLDVPVHLKDSV